MSQGQIRKRNPAARKWYGLLLEQGVILLSYLVLFLLSALIAYKTGCKREQSYYYAAVAFSLAALCGAAFAARRTGKNGLLVGLQKTAIGNFCVLVCAAVAAGFQPDMRILITAVILVLCACLGGILGVNLKKNPHLPHRRGRKK